MKLKKAIARSANIYSCLLSLFTLAILINGDSIIDKILLIFVIFLILLPSIFEILSSKHRNLLISVSLFILFTLGAFAVFFRKLRDILPNPSISNETSIGYSQYFGYPIYLDSVIFLIIVLSPILFLIFIKLTKRFKPMIKKNK